MTICTKFRYTWPSVFSQKCKSLQTDEGQQVIKKRAWTFSSGELKKTNAIGYKIYRDKHCQMLVCDTNGRGFTWCTRLGDSWDLWERRTPMVHLILSTYSFWKTLYFLKLCLARHCITELLCCYMWGSSHDRSLQSTIFSFNYPDFELSIIFEFWIEYTKIYKCVTIVLRYSVKVYIR